MYILLIIFILSFVTNVTHIFVPKFACIKAKKTAKIFILAILIMITDNKILREMLFLHISRCTTFTYLFDITSLQQFFQCTFNGRFADVRAYLILDIVSKLMFFCIMKEKSASFLLFMMQIKSPLNGIPPLNPYIIVRCTS